MMDSGLRKTLNYLAGIALSLLLCALIPAGVAAEEDGQGQYFNVRYASSELVDSVFRLNAQIDIHLSKHSIEALENGVPLVFDIKIEVLRERTYIWNYVIASLIQRYQLKYHALSQRYQVRNINTGVESSFRTRLAALGAVGELKDFPMLDQEILDSEQSYLVQIRADLDIEALPTPIRLWAYSSAKWRLTSEWYQWPLEY